MTGSAPNHWLPQTFSVASTLRPATQRDASTLRALQSYLREADADLLEYGIDDGSVVVTTAGPAGDVPPDTPVGYLLYIAADATRNERACAHIAELVVAPKYRRDGRGRALLACLLTTVSGRASLFVSPENGAALSLYQSMGFTIVAKRSGVYQDGPGLFLVRHPSSDSEQPPG